MYLKHGKTKTAEYSAWRMMRARCENPTHQDYPRYGGRGITVCDAWSEFVQFLSDMGTRPTPQHSLDREDNEGNYNPGNCRWALPVDQCNNRRSSRILIWDGHPITIAELARRENVPYKLLARRVRRNWPLEEAVRQPPSLVSLVIRKSRVVSNVR